LTSEKATVCGAFCGYGKFVGEFKKHWRASVDEIRNNFNNLILSDSSFTKYQELFANSINFRIAA
jgi:hypothetical protein